MHDVSLFDVALCSVFSKHMTVHHSWLEKLPQRFVMSMAGCKAGTATRVFEGCLTSCGFSSRFNRWWPWEKCPMVPWSLSWLETMRTTLQSCETLLP